MRVCPLRKNSQCQARDRALADVVAARDVARRLAQLVAPADRLGLLMLGQFGFIAASREAIRASRCSSHASRWATSRESLFVRVESSNRAPPHRDSAIVAQIPDHSAEAAWALALASAAGACASRLSLFAAR